MKFFLRSLGFGIRHAFAPSPAFQGASHGGGMDEELAQRLLRWTPWLVSLWWLVAAAIMPLTQDEAYYFQWAKALDFGYFDHPPLVALIGATVRWAPEAGMWTPLVARLGTVVTACLTMWLSLRLFRNAGLTDSRARLAALLLSHGNLIGLIYGFLTTPDVCLIFAWVLALHEALRALDGRPARWITAGLACGLGLEAKYTMLLMGLVFVWAMVRTPRRPGDKAPLATKWPYLGGIAAFALWLPHLAWNAQHDWITLSFQARHGFSMARPELPTPLPQAIDAPADSPERKLAAAFSALTEETDKVEKAPGRFDEGLKALNRYVGYYGSQLGIWGLMAPWILGALAGLRRARGRGGEQARGASLRPVAKPLLAAAALVPLLVFGLLSLASKVEANWSAMYVFGAAAWLAPVLARQTKWLGVGALIHVALLGGVLAHAHSGIFAQRPHRDRILLETHGYAALAKRLTALDAPVYGDSYQLVAMTRHYAPGLAMRQWPGITRPSEFLRRDSWVGPPASTLSAGGGLWLVTTDRVPPRLPGFVPTSLTLLRDCLDQPLQELDAHSALRVEDRCAKLVHEWQLIRYVPDITGETLLPGKPTIDPAARP